MLWEINCKYDWKIELDWRGFTTRQDRCSALEHQINVKPKPCEAVVRVQSPWETCHKVKCGPTEENFNLQGINNTLFAFSCFFSILVCTRLASNMKMVWNANPCQKVAVVSATKMIPTSTRGAVDDQLNHFESRIFAAYFYHSPRLPYLSTPGIPKVFGCAPTCAEKTRKARMSEHDDTQLKSLSTNINVFTKTYFYTSEMYTFIASTYWNNIFCLLRSQDALRLQQLPEGGHNPTQDCPRRKPALFSSPNGLWYDWQRSQALAQLMQLS